MTRASRSANLPSDYPQPKQAPAPERLCLTIGGVALSAAFGVLLVAIAFTAGRHGYEHSSKADTVYWVGQSLILIPVSVRLLTRRGLTNAGTVAAVVILTVAEYLCKVCYSPLAFTFSDELSHWRTAENILQTGRLFTTNYALPISPQYPGLEGATTALVQISGFPLFTAGLIVAGVAHLLFVVVLYLLFRNIGRSQRLAGIAVIVYSTNPDLWYFDALFAYQTLALGFFAVTLLATWRLRGARTRGDQVGWAAVATICIAATAATHHVTSYLLVLVLAFIALVSLLVKDRRSAAAAGALALVAAAVSASWLVFVASQTISYLLPEVTGFTQSVSALLTGGTVGQPTATTTTPGTPFSHVVIADVAALVLSGLLPLGWWQVKPYFRDRPWILALSIGSLAWYLTLGLRFITPNGSELAGRASSFVFVPSAFVAAFALQWLIDRTPRPRASTLLCASLAGVLLMLYDGMLNSWPPYWERLPGPHQVGGVEQSIGPEEIAVGNWILNELGPGNRFAADFGNEPMIGSYGDQTTVLGNSFLYTSPTFTPSIARQAQLLAIHYVLVDLRLTKSLPVSGEYFSNDPKVGPYTHPIPLADMTKFNYAPGVTRIFDAGNIVIYDLSAGN